MIKLKKTIKTRKKNDSSQLRLINQTRDQGYDRDNLIKSKLKQIMKSNS
jgi:hypothetical protein